MNHSYDAAEESDEPAPTGEISASRQSVIRDFLASADAMAAALAADDLGKFNLVSEPVMNQTSALTAVLESLNISNEKLATLNNARHFHGSDTLGEARSRFLKFTMAATDALTPLRRMKGFPDMQVWQCPMVSKAVPDAEDKGRWIQIGGRPIQNPFFGAEMLDCGQQLNP